ncbi:MAG: hypothetical protein HY822_14510 [Acidobacteria bacterium]|nr:hypothetical protein [Acidobacteriota bacterium]
MTSLKIQLDLLKLISGAEEGQPRRTALEGDTRMIEQFVRAAKPQSA